MTEINNEYYLEDTRQKVGNSMLWWKKDGKGYTCDVRNAHIFTKKEAFIQHNMRDTDRPWPKAYIDKRVSHHVDFQHVEWDLAISLKSLEDLRGLIKDKEES